MNFRPDIEGLRALAIVPVVLFHAFPSLLPGGFVGVDVFFVISGFLITSLLMQRLETGRYSIVAFYGARIRRIFPALFVMLALVTPLAVWLLSPAGLQEFGRTLGATAVFFSNMELYRTTGYFDTATELKPLVHTWSLAVEEQYYIVFPLLLALLFKRWRQGIAPVLAGVGLVSLGLSIWWLRTDPALSFYSALSRTFELMLGSLLAVGTWGKHASQALRELVAGLGLLCIVLACALLTPTTPFPGVAALLPCVGAALLIWAGGEGHQTWAGRVVSVAPLRWVGAMSFSLYLWHWPVLVFIRHWLLGEPAAWQAALGVAVSVLLAWASLKWVEAPVRRRSFSDRQLLAGGAACILVTLALAWFAVRHTSQLQPVSAAAQQFYAGVSDVNPRGLDCHGATSSVIPYENRCRYGHAGSARQAVVWGDSHGAELAYALGERASLTAQAVAQITSAACPPAVGLEVATRPLCLGHNDGTVKGLLADTAAQRVVMVARHEVYLQAYGQAYEAALERSVAALAAAGKQVVLVEPFPEFAFPVPAALGALQRRGEPNASLGLPREVYLRQQARALQLLHRLARDHGAAVLRTSEVLCSTGTCMTADGSHSLYIDQHHLSLSGARLVANDLPGIIP